MFKECPICGKIFEVNDFGRQKKYCSPKCRRKAEFEIRKEQRIVERKCEYCGKIFNGNKGKKYCSPECRKQAGLKIRKEKRIVERKCEYCGKIFKENGKWKYCSEECYTKAHQDKMNERNSYRWYHDKEYRKMKQLKHGEALGTFDIQENEEHDWEKEMVIIKALKKQAGLK